jgi:Zn-dependent peptidase ImmA (M78 family)
MKYTEIKVPFINSTKIEEAAEKFRRKYWNNVLPVNIENIIDVKLEINIIPVPEMEKIAYTNALITSNWKAIYVDKNLFENERRQTRLRFSLAHEIGHCILHKHIYDSFGIKSVEDFYRFIEDIPQEQYSYLEIQANKFASQLVIPRESLSTELNKELKNIGEEIKSIDRQALKPYIANPLSRKFGVSAEAMEIALGDLDYFKK